MAFAAFQGAQMASPPRRLKAAVPSPSFAYRRNVHYGKRRRPAAQSSPVRALTLGRVLNLTVDAYQIDIQDRIVISGRFSNIIPARS